MKTIVFIGSNKSGTSREALKIAEKMGYFTVLFTDRNKFIQQREEFTETHLMIYKKDLLNNEDVLNEINELRDKGKDIRAIVSLIDPFVSFSANLSKELGLIQLSINALYNMENKTRFRSLLKDLSCSPYYTILKKDELIKDILDRSKEYLPLVIKSPESNGSKDVVLVKTTDELIVGMKNMQSKEKTLPILIEEYLQGRQFLIEIIVYKQTISIVAVIEQEITSKKRFIITGYHMPAQLSSSLMEELEKTISEIIHKLGLINGSCHLEMRLVRGEWKLIEINPRISGGAMNRIIQYATGIDLVKETLRLYLGEKPLVEKKKNQFVFANYLIVERRGKLVKVTGKNRAKQFKGVKEVYVKPRKGSILTPPMSMGDRYAYVIATGDSPQEAKQNALRASKEIQFFLEPF